MAIKTDDKHPDVIALRTEEEKSQALQGDRAKEEEKLGQLTQLYMSRKQSNKQALLEAEADRLLGGTGTLPSADNDLKDIEAIEHKIAVLDIAISKQKAEVDKVRSRFSVHLCQINRAQYVEIERRIAKAVQELAAANEEEIRFFQALLDAGCSSISFRPMRINAIGIMADDQSVARFHEREVKEFCPEAAA